MTDLLLDENQLALFDPQEIPPNWREHWDGMPAFDQGDIKPYDSINVQFRNEDDRRAFLLLLGEHPDRRRTIWYPPMQQLLQSARNAAATVVERNKYPVYVISKGRWETRLTGRALERLGIPYKMVIEPQELQHYAQEMSVDDILILPFSNLGQGSIPARNWVWDHALESGATRHWILDDNMDGFYRLHENLKKKVVDENPFTPLEQFTDKFENVALSGMNYEFFADRRSSQPPYVLNTSIYSCILINHALPHRWRGRYNEDTDLSIRALKDGWCTILFNNFLAKKMPTMTMSGGNTAELYKNDGRLKMAQSLVEQHPDIVRVTQKWGRPQHHVDYRQFRANKLIPAKQP
jgi:hypothetical protein